MILLLEKVDKRNSISIIVPEQEINSTVACVYAKHDLIHFISSTDYITVIGKKVWVSISTLAIFGFKLNT